MKGGSPFPAVLLLSHVVYKVVDVPHISQLLARLLARLHHLLQKKRQEVTSPSTSTRPDTRLY